MTRAFLGLGSNVGDRLRNLDAATELLRERDGITVVARSSVYATEPVGDAPPSPDFYNAALEIETELEPRQLLAACKEVERRLGRPTGGPRHAPRPIDVDVLLYGEMTLSEEGVTIPHPEIANRRFVLAPLAELDSALTLPDGRSLDQALAAIGGHQRVEVAQANGP